MPPKGSPPPRDMYTAEEIGFEKLDILSQGNRSYRESAEIILRNRGIDVVFTQYEIQKRRKGKGVPENR